MKQKHILFVAQRYANVVVPFLFVGLGVYIIVKSSCYPWSIQHINRSTSAHPGKTIMAVATTVFLLTCMGAMLWFKLRKKAAQPIPCHEPETQEQETTDKETKVGDRDCNTEAQQS